MRAAFRESTLKYWNTIARVLIYDSQVWEGRRPSRRAMHEAAFESGWDSAAFIKQHRAEVAQVYQGRGRQMTRWIGRLPI
jgi:hypothetical protein